MDKNNSEENEKEFNENIYSNLNSENGSFKDNNSREENKSEKELKNINYKIEDNINIELLGTKERKRNKTTINSKEKKRQIIKPKIDKQITTKLKTERIIKKEEKHPKIKSPKINNNNISKSKNQNKIIQLKKLPNLKNKSETNEFFKNKNKINDNINNIKDNNSNIRNIKNKKKILNSDLLDTDFHNKTYSSNTFNKNNCSDLNLTQSLILPNSIIKEKKNKKKKLPNGNISGNRMYQQYMEKLPKKLEERKKLLEIEQRKKEGELIFHPKINEKSRKIVKDIFEKNKVENLLLNYGEEVKNKKLNLYHENIKKESENLEFKPTISKKTNKLGEIKRNERKDINQYNNININPDYLNYENQIQKEFSFDESFFKNTQNTNFESLNNNNNNIKKKYIPKKQYGKNIIIPKLDPTKNIYDYLYIESKLLDQKMKEKK